VGQEVLRRLLEPLFEPLFQAVSFGFRPKRNCHQAIQWVLSLHDDGYGFVLDANIEGFFDHIPQNVIRQLVADKVPTVLSFAFSNDFSLPGLWRTGCSNRPRSVPHKEG